MELIDFHKKYFHNKKLNKFYVYPTQQKEIGAIMLKVRGRFPRMYVATNKGCKMMIHFLYGDITVWTPEREQKMEENDIAVIDKDENFMIKGIGAVMLISVPAFSKEQLVVAPYVDRYLLSIQKAREERAKNGEENVDNRNNHQVYVYPAELFKNK